MTQSSYQGTIGHTYSFYSVATDQAGNREPGKSVAEAATVVNGAAVCAADVTSQYTVVRGGFRRDSSGLFIQTITATAKSGSADPQGLRLVLSSLPAGVTLSNAAGRTTCGGPAGSPYVLFPVGSPGISGNLQFTNPNNVGITYTLQLFSPAGSL